MRKPNLIPLFLVACLLTPAGASAAELDSAFVTAGATTFHGPHELEWRLAAASLGTGGSAVLRAQGIDIQLVNTPFERTVVPRPGTHPITMGGYAQEESLLAWPSVAEVRFEVGDGLLRALPGDDGLEGDSRGDALDLAHPGTNSLEASGSPYFLLSQVGGKRTSPAREPPFTDVTLTDGTLGVTLGGDHVLFSGGTAYVEGAAVELPRMRLNETASTYDPVTGAGKYVYDNHHMVIEVRDGRLHGEGPWALAAHSLAGSLHGRATWFGVEGDIQAGDDFATDPTVLEVDGNLTMAADLADTTGRWQVEGETTSVRADLMSIGAAVPVAVGSLGVLALLVSLVTAAGRSVVTFLLGRWTPSGVQATPLESRARRNILAAIHAHQPVRMGDLQDLTGLSRGSLRYHLRILEVTRILQHDDSGGPRQKAFMLNSGSLRFAIDPCEDALAAGALSSAATHPVRTTVYESLLREGSQDQAALLDALHRAGRPVARSTLSHHLSRMVASGLLSSSWQGGRKVYDTLLRPESARAEQYRRYLGSEGLMAPVEHVLGGTTKRTALIASLESDGVSPKRARSMVGRLEALAILEPHGRRLRLTPAVHAALTHGRHT